MDIEERQARIAEIIRAHKQVKALDLSKRFDVSVETIRKDLLDLQDRGVLVRVHGGARLGAIGQESAYERRRAVNTEAKAAIAQAAASLIDDGDTVFLDYGTTTLALAAELAQTGRRITILTDALPIANLLADVPAIETVLLGGILRGDERAMYGPLTERALEEFNMHVGFFGCGGIHPEGGITNHHPFEASVSGKAMRKCGKVVVLAAADKLDTIAVHKVADLSRIDALITDTQPSASLTEALLTTSVATTIAQPTTD